MGSQLLFLVTMLTPSNGQGDKSSGSGFFFPSFDFEFDLAVKNCLLINSVSSVPTVSAHLPTSRSIKQETDVPGVADSTLPVTQSSCPVIEFPAILVLTWSYRSSVVPEHYRGPWDWAEAGHSSAEWNPSLCRASTWWGRGNVHLDVCGHLGCRVCSALLAYCWDSRTVLWPKFSEIPNVMAKPWVQPPLKKIFLGVQVGNIETQNSWYIFEHAPPSYILLFNSYLHLLLC